MRAHGHQESPQRSRADDAERGRPARRTTIDHTVAQTGVRPLSPGEVLAAQRSVGNAAVAGLLTTSRSPVPAVQRMDTGEQQLAYRPRRTRSDEDVAGPSPKRLHRDASDLLVEALSKTTLADYLDYRSLVALANVGLRPSGGESSAASHPAGGTGPSGRAVRQAVFDKVRERLPGAAGEDLYGMSMAGVVRLMERNPDRLLAQDPAGPAERDEDTRAELPHMIKHVGYRQYVADGQPEEMTLERYGQQALLHARLKALFNEVPPHIRFPIKAVNSAVDQSVREYVEAWRSDTRAVFETQPRTTSNRFDHLAKRALGMIQGAGQHVSIVGGSATDIVAVYTNNPLKDEEVSTITHYLADEGLTAEIHFGPTDRAGWTKEHGIGRAGAFEYKFHSEMQQTLEKEPWQIRQYTGNAYRTCPQCMRGFAALGVPSTLHWEPHNQKSPSVIPPAIRENTAYLRHYLGEASWRTWEPVLAAAWAQLKGPQVERRQTAAGAEMQVDDAAQEQIKADLARLNKDIQQLWNKKTMADDAFEQEMELAYWDDLSDSEKRQLLDAVTELQTSLAHRKRAQLDLTRFFAFLSTIERIKATQLDLGPRRDL